MVQVASCYSLTNMRSVEFVPSPPLRQYVRLFWLLESGTEIATAPPQRIAPDGLVELVFHYRSPMQCRYDGEEFQKQPRSSVISQTDRFLEFRATGATGLISVRFQPWGAYHFFNDPVSAFADRLVAADSLWGAESGELEERLNQAVTDRQRIRLLEQFLMKQLAANHKPDVEPAIRTVWKRRGQISVREICADLGVGERTAERVFSRATGMPPKRFARLSRFLNACAQLRKRGRSSFTEVGLACGYYDQAHFISDFKSYSGMTPGKFVEAENLSFLETT